MKKMRLEKIPVVFESCSSYDPSTNPIDIQNKGWQSERFCVFPQTICFKVKALWKLQKIQILLHHFKISSKIEIAIINDQNSLTKLGNV